MDIIALLPARFIHYAITNAMHAYTFCTMVTVKERYACSCHRRCMTGVYTYRGMGRGVGGARGKQPVYYGHHKNKYYVSYLLISLDAPKYSHLYAASNTCNCVFVVALRLLLRPSILMRSD